MARKRKKRGINPNINQIKKHNFVQGNYKIIWQKPYGCNGECSDPNDRKIWLNPRVDDKELLKNSIDESIHACLWPIDNDYVYEMSDCIAEFLYKIGFRLEKKQ